MGHYESIFCIVSKKSDHRIQKNHRIDATGYGKHIFFLSIVFYISSTYAKREVVWSYTNDKIIIYETSIKGKILKKRSEFSEQKAFLFDNSANIEANECIELDGDYLGYRIQTPNGQLFSKEHLLNIECFLKTPQNITFLNSLKNEMIKHKIMLYKIE